MSTSASGTTTFKLRTPAHINSCHLVGSWDKYTKRYECNKGGEGLWTLSMKLTSLPTGRYWYYYILDGYFNSHDPNKPNTTEPKRNQTLNILDLPALGSASSAHSSRHSSREQSPSSASTASSSSSRFPSPSSSAGTSPVSASSKRSGHVFTENGKPISYRPRDRSPLGTEYYSTSPDSTHSRSSSGSTHRRRRSDVPKIRTPSPRRAHAHLSHIAAPKPRNPLGVHKLTLDTNYARPYSMITTAATTAGDSPVSASSSRSNSSMGSAGSYCSSCSGTTCSDLSSPTTPICTCRYTTGHRRGECGAGYSDESCGEEYSDSEIEYSEDEEDDRIRVAPHSERRKTYHAGHDDLAHRFERSVRV